jgi:heat shock protein HtpX
LKAGLGKRVLLLVATNVAIVLVLAVVLRLVGFNGILDEEGRGLDYGSLLVLSAVIGFTGAFISLAMSKWVAKRFTGAQVITQPRTETEIWLVMTVQRLARQAGIGMPEVAIFDSADMNAFATGARRDNALVAVSTGLLRGMDKEAVEAVLAHEIAHVANGDMVTLTLIQGVVNTFVVFFARVIGHVVDRTIFRTERGHGPGFWIVTIVAQVLLGIAATMIVMWFSRWREFRADRGSANLVGPQPMIKALQSLKRAQVPTALPDSIQTFGIRAGPGSGLSRMFRSHPDLDERIAVLQGAR